MASGRTDVFAKLYWLELVPYIILIIFLTSRFGSVGAAAAWSICGFVDAVLLFYFAKKTVGVLLPVFSVGFGSLAIATAAMATPTLATLGMAQYSESLLVVFFAGLVVYVFVVWNKFLAADERLWIGNRLYAVINR